jgi:rubrerythrin
MPLPSEHARPELLGTRTHDLLRDAFAREAQLARLLGELSRMATFEGFPQVGKVLAELAETESLLASGHLDFLRRVGEPLSDAPLGGTEENLAAVTRLLTVELTEKQPDEARAARSEGFPDVASWFETVAHTRRGHLERLAEATRTVRREEER